MAKKRRQAARGKKKQRQEKARTKKKFSVSLPAMLVAAVLLAAGGIYYFTDKPVQPVDRNLIDPAGISHKMMETRPTLPPDRFYGSVRSAYAAAREIPEVLDQLYCYCRCRENFDHLNLLTCYTDNHAST